MTEGHEARGKIWRALGVAAIVLSIPTVAAIASDRFGDVPNTHVFHDDIAWLADRGITRGCNPPANTSFCPDDPVTRGQMAAFMRRFADTVTTEGNATRLSGTGAPPQLLANETWTTLASATISAPVGGAVLIDGGASVFAQEGSSSGALGLILATVNQSCSDSAQGPAAVWETAGVGLDSTSLSGVVAVSGGSSIVRLCGLALQLSTSERTEVLGPALSAVWFPASQASLQSDTEPQPVSDLVSTLRERASHPSR